MRGLFATTCTVGLLLGLGAAPATASSPSAAADPLGWGIRASVTWIAHDPDNLVKLRGNAYDVALGAEVNPIGRFIGGYIAMYGCKPGEIIGGQDPGPGQCAYLGSLSLRGYPAATLTFDKTTGSAGLTARFASTHDDGTAGRTIRVSLAWTGVGDPTQQTYDFGFGTDDGASYVIHGWRRNWTATATGHIGPVVSGTPGDDLVEAGTARYSVKSYRQVG
jgi:hypothetical protein